VNLLLVAATALIAASATADDVTIALVDGRQFVAAVDGQTSDALLWLRFENGPTTIRRSFRWSTIRTMREGTKEVDAARVRELGRQAGAAAPKPAPIANAKPVAIASTRGTLRTWRLPNDAPADLPPFTGTIRAIDIDAYLANWDSDVEADGVVVTLAALDQFGAPAPVIGTVEAELIGERLPPYSLGNAFPVLGRWQQAISVADIANEGAVHRLRFDFWPQQHPDYQLYLPRYALLHVRFSIPGQGTFEASRDGISLRGFTPVRDRLESASGTRLFPLEQSGRGHPGSSYSMP
jgi:hypothetical protein